MKIKHSEYYHRVIETELDREKEAANKNNPDYREEDEGSPSELS